MYTIVLLLCILLSGCRQPPPVNKAVDTTPAETIPVETVQIETPPVETEITSKAITDFSKYYAILDLSAEERNWIFFSTGCNFSRPEEIDLNFLFYLGVGHNGSWPDISTDSRQHLIDHEFMYEMDIQIMPVEVLNRILQDTFGTSLSDMNIPTEWEYIEAEDAYCSNHNDAYFPEPPVITGITEYSDGTVEIFYTVNFFYDSSTGEFYENPLLILKLTQTVSGNWLVLSNTLT